MMIAGSSGFGLLVQQLSNVRKRDLKDTARQETKQQKGLIKIHFLI